MGGSEGQGMGDHSMMVHGLEAGPTWYGPRIGEGRKRPKTEERATRGEGEKGRKGVWWNKGEVPSLWFQGFRVLGF